MSIEQFSEILLKGTGIELWPKQKEMLSSFYNGNYYELVMILGRRSGKNFIGSIVLAYELYRLITITDGNPWKHYNLAPGNPVYVSSISGSLDQAKILFIEFKQRVKNLISKNKLFSHTIKYSDDDLSIELKTKYSKIIVSFLSPHADNALGKQYFALLLNEPQSIKNINRIYSALTPGGAAFKQDFHSIVCGTPSPTKKEDYLFSLKKDGLLSFTKNKDKRLVFQYPTWEVNLNLPRHILRNMYKEITEQQFEKEFGAVISETENLSLSIRLPSDQINDLKKIARKLAYEQDKEITYVDLIRTAVGEYLTNHRLGKNL